MSHRCSRYFWDRREFLFRSGGGISGLALAWADGWRTLGSRWLKHARLMSAMFAGNEERVRADQHEAGQRAECSVDREMSFLSQISRGRSPQPTGLGR